MDAAFKIEKKLYPNSVIILSNKQISSRIFYIIPSNIKAFVKLEGWLSKKFGKQVSDPTGDSEE